MTVAIKALEDKGVRVNESDFRDEDVVRRDQYVVIFRGDAAKLFDCLFERGKDCLSTEHLPHGVDVPVSHLDSRVDAGHQRSVERSLDRGELIHGGEISLENVEHMQPH